MSTTPSVYPAQPRSTSGPEAWASGVVGTERWWTGWHPCLVAKTLDSLLLTVTVDGCRSNRLADLLIPDHVSSGLVYCQVTAVHKCLKTQFSQLNSELVHRLYNLPNPHPHPHLFYFSSIIFFSLFRFCCVSFCDITSPVKQERETCCSMHVHYGMNTTVLDVHEQHIGNDDKHHDIINVFVQSRGCFANNELSGNEIELTHHASRRYRQQ